MGGDLKVKLYSSQGSSTTVAPEPEKSEKPETLKVKLYSDKKNNVIEPDDKAKEAKPKEGFNPQELSEKPKEPVITSSSGLKTEEFVSSQFKNVNNVIDSFLNQPRNTAFKEHYEASKKKQNMQLEDIPITLGALGVNALNAEFNKSSLEIETNNMYKAGLAQQMHDKFLELKANEAPVEADLKRLQLLTQGGVDPETGLKYDGLTTEIEKDSFHKLVREALETAQTDSDRELYLDKIFKQAKIKTAENAPKTLEEYNARFDVFKKDLAEYEALMNKPEMVNYQKRSQELIIEQKKIAEAMGDNVVPEISDTFKAYLNYKSSIQTGIGNMLTAWRVESTQNLKKPWQAYGKGDYGIVSDLSETAELAASTAALAIANNLEETMLVKGEANAAHKPLYDENGNERLARWGDKEMYTEVIPSTFGSMSSLMGPGILAGVGAAALVPEAVIAEPVVWYKSLKSLWNISRTATIAFSAAKVSRELESDMEQGGYWAEGMKKWTNTVNPKTGTFFSDEEAEKALMPGFLAIGAKNDKMVYLDAAQYAFTMMPIAKYLGKAASGIKNANRASLATWNVASGILKVGAGMFSEGFEEDIQGLWQYQEDLLARKKAGLLLPGEVKLVDEAGTGPIWKKAFWEGYQSWKLTPERQQSIEQGGFMGGVMGGGGELVSYLQDADRRIEYKRMLLATSEKMFGTMDLTKITAQQRSLLTQLLSENAVAGTTEKLKFTLSRTHQDKLAALTDQNEINNLQKEFAGVMAQLDEFTAQARALDKLEIDNRSKERIITLDARGKQLQVEKDTHISELKAREGTFKVSQHIIDELSAQYDSYITENQKNIDAIYKEGFAEFQKTKALIENNQPVLPKTPEETIGELNRAKYGKYSNATPETLKGIDAITAQIMTIQSEPQTPESQVKLIDLFTQLDELESDALHESNTATGIENLDVSELLSDAPAEFDALMSNIENGKQVKRRSVEEALNFLDERRQAIETTLNSPSGEYHSKDLRKALAAVDSAEKLILAGEGKSYTSEKTAKEKRKAKKAAYMAQKDQEEADKRAKEMKDKKSPAYRKSMIDLLIGNEATTVNYTNNDGKTTNRTLSEVRPGKEAGVITAFDSERGERRDFQVSNINKIVSEKKREFKKPENKTEVVEETPKTKEELLEEKREIEKKAFEDHIAKLQAEADALREEIKNEKKGGTAPMNVPLGEFMNSPANKKLFKLQVKILVAKLQQKGKRSIETIGDMTKAFGEKVKDFADDVLQAMLDAAHKEYDELMALKYSKNDPGHYETAEQATKAKERIGRRTKKVEVKKTPVEEDNELQLELQKTLRFLRDNQGERNRQTKELKTAHLQIDASNLSDLKKREIRKQFNNVAFTYLAELTENQIENAIRLKELGFDEDSIEYLTNESAASFNDVGNDVEFKKVSYLFNPRNEETGERVGIKDENGNIIPEREVANFIWNYSRNAFWNPPTDLKAFYAGMQQTNIAKHLSQYSQGELNSLYVVMSSTIRMPYQHLNANRGELKLIPSNTEGFEYNLYKALIEIANEKLAQTGQEEFAAKLAKIRRAMPKFIEAGSKARSIESPKNRITPFYKEYAQVNRNYQSALDDYEISGLHKDAVKAKELEDKVRALRSKIKAILADVVAVEADLLEDLTGINKKYWIRAENLDAYTDSYLAYPSTAKSSMAAFVYEGLPSYQIYKKETKERAENHVEDFMKNLTHEEIDKKTKKKVVKSQVETLIGNIKKNREQFKYVKSFKSVEGSRQNADLYISTVDLMIEGLPFPSVQLNKEYEENEYVMYFNKRAPMIESFEGQTNLETKLNAANNVISKIDILVAAVENFATPRTKGTYMQFFDQQKDFTAKLLVEAPIYTRKQAKILLLQKPGITAEMLSDEARDVEAMLEQFSKNSTTPITLPNKKNSKDKMSLHDLAIDFTYNFMLNKRNMDDYFQPEMSTTGIANFDSYSDKTKRSILNRGMRLNTAILRDKLAKLHKDGSTTINMSVFDDAKHKFPGMEKAQKLSDGIYYVLDDTGDILNEAAGSILDIDKTYKLTYSKHDKNNTRTFIKGHGMKITKSMAEMNPTYAAIYEYMKANDIDFLAFDSSVKKYDRKGAQLEATWTNQDEIASMPDYNTDKHRIAVDPDYLLLQQNLKQSEEFEALKATRQQFYYATRMPNYEKVQSLLNGLVTDKYHDFIEDFLQKDEAFKKAFLRDQTSKNSDKYDFLNEFLKNPNSSLNSTYFQGIIEKILSGYVRNKILRIDINKQISIEAPLLGGYKKAGETKLSKLNSVRIENGKIQPAEALVPQGYEKQGFKVGDIVFINRVPGTELHSSTAVRIAGFLPKDTGNYIMTGQETRLISGADYDGDLRHIWSKFKKDGKFIKDDSYEGVMNEIFDLMMDDYLGKGLSGKELENHFDMITAPIDTEANKDLIAKHESRIENNLDRNRVTSWLYKIESSQDGKVAISIGARFAAIYQSLEKFGAGLKKTIRIPEFEINAEGQSVEKKNAVNTPYKSFKHDAEVQQKVRMIMANMLNHATDNSSLGKLDPMGVNRYTVGLAYLLAGSGMEEQQIYDFLNHPVVTKFVELSREYSSPNYKKGRRDIFLMLAELYAGSGFQYDPAGRWEKKYTDLVPADFAAVSTKENATSAEKQKAKELANEANRKIVSMLDYIMQITDNVLLLASVEKVGEEPVSDFASYHNISSAMRMFMSDDAKFDNAGVIGSDALAASRIGRKVYAESNEDSNPFFTRAGEFVYSHFKKMLSTDSSLNGVIKDGLLQRELNRQFAIDAIGIAESKEDIAIKAKKVFDDIDDDSPLKNRKVNGEVIPGLLRWDETTNRLVLQDTYKGEINESERRVFRKAFEDLRKIQEINNDEATEKFTDAILGKIGIVNDIEKNPLDILIQHQIMEYGWVQAPRHGEYASFMDLETHVEVSQKMAEQFDKWNDEQFDNTFGDNPILEAFVKQMQLNNISLIPQVLIGENGITTTFKKPITSGSNYVKSIDEEGVMKIYNLHELLEGERGNYLVKDDLKEISMKPLALFTDPLDDDKQVGKKPRSLEEMAKGLYNPTLEALNIYSEDKNGFENLSNFKHGPVSATLSEKGEKVFKTVEHLYHAKKVLFAINELSVVQKDETRIERARKNKLIEQAREVLKEIMKATTGRQAYSAGHIVPGLNIQKWKAKESAELESAMRLAFSQNIEAAKLLMSTGSRLLTHLGGSNNKWTKQFPYILMKIRADLNSGKLKIASPVVPVAPKSNKGLTKQGNVKIIGQDNIPAFRKPDGKLDYDGMIAYAKANGMVYALRNVKSNKHFGNAFSNRGIEGTIKMGSVAAANQAYKDWILTDKYDKPQDNETVEQFTLRQERKAWIKEILNSGALKGKSILYWKELNEKSHANALDELINSGPAEQAKFEKTERIILKAEVQKNRKTLYVFGDNDTRKGLGGQAKEMRGEPNAIGVTTKKYPSNDESSFKLDAELEANKKAITADINKVIAEWNTGKYTNVVVPQIGVGMAKLPTRAPKTFAFLQQELARLEAVVNAPVEQSKANQPKVVSKEYGVVQVETNPTKQETQHIIDLIVPQIKAQTYKENKGKFANEMFHFGLMWARKNAKANPVKINSFEKAGYYAYHALDQNGNALPNLSELKPIMDMIEKALGISMADYDSMIGNIYLPGEYVYPHKDTTESKTARNYPVIVYTIGNDAGLGIVDDNKGKMTFANKYNTDNYTNPNIPIGYTNELITKNGSIYTFGFEGKGRFELTHSTPINSAKKEKFPPITLPNGKVITNYTITLTFRRAQDLIDGMPASPNKKANPKDTGGTDVSGSSSMTTEQAFQKSKEGLTKWKEEQASKQQEKATLLRERIVNNKSTTVVYQSGTRTATRTFTNARADQYNPNMFHAFDSLRNEERTFNVNHIEEIISEEEKGNNIFTMYQGYKDKLDNRKYNYWTLNRNEAEDYTHDRKDKSSKRNPKNVREQKVDTANFLIKYSPEFTAIQNEWVAKGNKYFDILDNDKEGLQNQTAFFDFLVEKGYKGYSELIGTDKQQENAYAVTFDKKKGFDVKGLSPAAHDFINTKKALLATNFIGYGRDTATRKSSTLKYANAAKEQGIPVNSGSYTSDTIAMVAVSGNNVATQEDINNTVEQISKVLKAGGSIIMDNKTNRSSSWNASGEGKVFDIVKNKVGLENIENISKDKDFVQIKLKNTSLQSLDDDVEETKNHCK